MVCLIIPSILSLIECMKQKMWSCVAGIQFQIVFFLRCRKPITIGGGISMKFLASRAVVLVSLALSVYAAFVAHGALDAYQDVRLTATTFATLSATLFGFLMTSLSILIAISDREFIRNLRLTG